MANHGNGSPQDAGEGTESRQNLQHPQQGLQVLPLQLPPTGQQHPLLVPRPGDASYLGAQHSDLTEKKTKRNINKRKEKKLPSHRE